ncbi:RmlC-like jelly roll fold protein [Metarhizium album ARSEF 1941]|uniref:RmlC-like jelly roll fold protein n=1 Tax=Metarhizium album (strain ARSEF 1941) TaxID=1081103 RepID=A0A0B2WMH5_METAS|nr:RmlC-like jelly roll fold protein [Metarhizium album ARSEF 1941]KHN94884.1 RmlC-like jelly roll fold protein [Metarhizium album ARSEF 1941]
MDAKHEEYASTLKVNHFKPENVPWRRLGQYFWRPIEDGSNTQYRLGVIESLIPPRSDGPVFHFHEMHDEGFYVTKGKVRFHVPGRPSVDVAAGEMVTVPVRLPHKFSNPFDDEAVFINTATPGFFVRYFEHLENLIGEGKVLTPEVNAEALKRFATIPLAPGDVERLEETGMAGEKTQRPTTK